MIISWWRLFKNILKKFNVKIAPQLPWLRSELDAGTGVGGSGEGGPIVRSVPKDSEFYKAWAKENAKESLKTINTSLGQILTLSTALLAATVTFWKSIPLAEPYNFIVLAVLLPTITISLLAAMPVIGEFDPSNASSIRDHMEKTFKKKIRRLRISQGFFILSILTMSAGLLSTYFITN